MTQTESATLPAHTVAALNKLVERIKSAPNEPAFETFFFEHAWEQIAPLMQLDAVEMAKKAARFGQLVASQAFESAAVMFVPPNHDWAMFGGGYAGCAPFDEDDVPSATRLGATSALALLCACVKEWANA